MITPSAPPRKGPRLARLVRVLVACGLLVAAFGFYGPRVVETVTYDAVLNAPVLAVRSPIGGTLVQPPPPPGTVVRTGTLLAEIVDPRAASAVLEELATARDSAEHARLAFAAEDAGLAAIAASLAEGAEAHRRATRVALSHRLAIAEAELTAAQAEAERAAKEHGRANHLAATDTISRHRHDQTAAASRTADAEAEVARTRIAQLRAEISALDAGVYVGDDHNDVPYSRQRLDEVELRRLEVQRRMGELAAQRDALDTEMAIKRGRLQALDRVALEAPRDGIVWRNHVDGTAFSVDPGEVTSLIACDDLVVTASLPTRNLEDFVPGSPARIRPVGSQSWWPARVEQIRGMGIETQADRYAAAPPVGADRRMIVTLRPDDPLGVTEGARFCDVGRTVEVRIAGATARRLTAWGDVVGRWFEPSGLKGVATVDEPGGAEGAAMDDGRG
ncbi:MAG: hypothetical protein EA356_03695 [Geminicoccaceae bacterium]|nr:MAG: hypothetical protein EA356_03695 [Geminicoccaceae bacterium]